VVFAGFHDGDALLPLYAAADAFVFPTLGDAFGMVVLEAMACGLPVISTSAAGEIADRIDEGVNGFVVPPADVEALRSRMEVLAADESIRSRMGKAATAKVRRSVSAALGRGLQRGGRHDPLTAENPVEGRSPSAA
jgi:phosphatidylinositol alpha 1,6-mannosyltransferase